MDWDYQFSLAVIAPHVNMREYKDWRMTGVAFETRLSNNTVPNRTLGSFVEGKKV